MTGSCDSRKTPGVRRSLLGLRILPKHTKIAEETNAELQRLCHEADKSESDFIATLIEIRCHGLAVVQRIEAARIEIVSGSYPPRINSGSKE